MKVLRWLTVMVLTGISLVLEFSSEVEHGNFSWESIPVFYIIFGFIGSVVMIIVPKLIGTLFLVKREGYYDVG
jgi:hypothetical protein